MNVTATGTFRILYRADLDAVVIPDVCSKKTKQTPRSVIDTCKRRVRECDRLTGDKRSDEEKQANKARSGRMGHRIGAGLPRLVGR